MQTGGGIIMNKIKIGAQVTAKVRYTKVTVSGTFQGYGLEDQEDPTSVCGKVFYVKDGIQRLDFVYADSIKVCDISDERIKNLIYCIVRDRGDVGKLLEANGCPVEKALSWIEKQKEQKPVHTAKEMWKEMRLEVYAQASGNRHEPNYSDDSTKMFSLCDIDEIFEKIGDSTVSSRPAEWSEEDEDKVDDICKLIEHATIIPRSGDDDTGIPPTRLNDKYKGELKAFVKSLRNSLTKLDTWKPSSEHIVMLEKVGDGQMLNSLEQMAIADLCCELKKLV